MTDRTGLLSGLLAALVVVGFVAGPAVGPAAATAHDSTESAFVVVAPDGYAIESSSVEPATTGAGAVGWEAGTPLGLRADVRRGVDNRRGDGSQSSGPWR